MPSILNTSVSGLLSFQRSLATTAHNIANASTPGFSRQRTALQALPGQALADGHVGRGVGVLSVERIRDDFVHTRLRDAITDDGRTRMYAELAAQLDNLFAAENSGLAPALSGFFDAVHDVANDPASSVARQLLLSEAATLVDRFRFMDAQLEVLRHETNSRLGAVVADVNALADDVARLNEDIVVGLAQGSPPNDLLDQRDERINRLAALLGVTTVVQDNGAINVFTSSGQALVVDASVQRWSVAADAADPGLVQVADASGAIISERLAGGELGGLLDFRREAMGLARNELGRIAVVLADTVNAQHRLGMDADGNLGQDLFQVPGAAVIANANNTGAASVSVTVTDASQLTASDYRLSYDGVGYTLLRVSDGASVSGAGPLSLNGMQVSVSAGALAGDRFVLAPAARGAQALALALTDPDRIAAAGPVRSAGAPGNQGDGQLAQPVAIDAGNPALLATVDLVFNDPPDTFDLIDVGSGVTLAAGVAFSAGAAIAANGWSTSIGGDPAPGDRFRVQANAGGIADNRNALAIADLHAGALIEGRLSYAQGYSALVGRAGTSARSAQFNADARERLLADAVAAREAVSGVNLDEEAIDLTRFQQAYQAMARMVDTSNTLFDAILLAVR